MRMRSIAGVLCAAIFFGGAYFARAQSLNGVTFTDSNPVITLSGGHATSTHFQMYSGTGQTVIGESTGSSFQTRSGFFYFPLVTSPVLVATPGNAQVSLTWSAAVGSLGYNVSSYQVGRGSSAGGPFSYTAVGNALSYTVTALTNNQTYYFVVQALDAFGTVVATSAAVAGQPLATIQHPGGNGGTGSPGLPVSNALLQVSGATSPEATVKILRNGVEVGSITAGNDGEFFGTVSGIPVGQAIITVFAMDDLGNRSAAISFLLPFTSGNTTVLSSLFLPPIVYSDKVGVKTGDTFTLIGYGQPNSSITIFNQPGKEVAKTTADAQGRFEQKFDTDGLPTGNLTFTVRSEKQGKVSEWSKPVTIKVGDKTIETAEPSTCTSPADFNHDCRVNLVDFSILIYWFDRANPPTEVDLTQNSQIDLADFSILMYYWTG